MTDKKDINIQILGQAYTIKTSADEKYIRKLENYVEGQIEELKGSGFDSKTQHLKIAILTCINIADDLFQEKENNKNEFVDKIKSKTISLKEYVDQQILSFEKRDEAGTPQARLDEGAPDEGGQGGRSAEDGEGGATSAGFEAP